MRTFLLLLFLSARLACADEITVAAAASLKPVFDKLPHPGVTFTYGGSGTLQKQIENGAPIDVFISAATSQMDTLEKHGLILPGSRTNFLGNELVLIVPADSQLIAKADDLAKPAVHHIALGETNSVPAGHYAAQSLNALSLTAKIIDKAVYASDVRQVLAYVERGDADAGFVYRSDAQGDVKVRSVVEISNTMHDPIIYCAAVVKASAKSDAAAAFVRSLTSTESQKVFHQLGFTPIPPSR